MRPDLAAASARPARKRRKPRNAGGAAPDGGAATRQGLAVAAAGLALLDATSGQARTKPIDGVRLVESQAPAAVGDPYQHGRTLLASGDVTGAITAFRAALVETPQSLDALNGLAVAYDRLGRFDISRSYYDAALAIDPDSALVLNNLGYSLYLQGQYQAAIPLLQRATASNDDAARKAGQRVLNLVAVRIREKAAETSMAIAVAEISQPQARIETVASGEQRLVFAAPAPDAELTARLGEAAALVMVPKQWTPRDEAALVARDAIETRQAMVARAAAAAERAALASRVASALAAARTDGALLMPTAPLRDGDQAPGISVIALPPLARAQDRAAQTALARTSAMVAGVGRSDDIADRIVDALAMRLNPVAADRGADLAPMAGSGTTDSPALDNRGVSPGQGPAATADTPLRVANALAAHVEGQVGDGIEHSSAAAAAVGSISVADDAAPAWLLASRRSTRAEQATTVLQQGPLADSAAAAFDSDDADLNSFAARMRGMESPVDPMLTADQAVVRLETLLRRLRAA